MPLFLNNCENRPHATLFHKPEDGELIAFFDLYRKGVQATKAQNLSPGTECIVATVPSPSHVRFEWFTFERENVRPSDEGIDVRVFLGTKLTQKGVTLPQAEAVRTEPYATFFDRNGAFKRGSVIAHT